MGALASDGNVTGECALIKMVLDPAKFPDLPCVEGYTLVIDKQEDGSTKLVAQFKIHANETIPADAPDADVVEITNGAINRIVSHIRKHFCGIVMWEAKERA